MFIFHYFELKFVCMYLCMYVCMYVCMYYLCINKVCQLTNYMIIKLLYNKAGCQASKIIDFYFFHIHEKVNA
jgi:hypothetical protein